MYTEGVGHTKLVNKNATPLFDVDPYKLFSSKVSALMRQVNERELKEKRNITSSIRKKKLTYNEKIAYLNKIERDFLNS